MLVIFKSRAAGEVIMYEENAKPILDLLGKDVKRGIITAGEMAGAIATLEAEIARRKKIELEEKAAHEAQQEKEEYHHGSPASKPEIVTFSARAFPLLEMFQLAHRKDREIVWGV